MYTSIIKNPMDLSILKNELDKQSYGDNADQYLADFILLWDNCYHFYEPQSSIVTSATKLQKMFVKRMISSNLFTESEINAAQDPEPEKYIKIKSFLFFLCRIMLPHFHYLAQYTSHRTLRHKYRVLDRRRHTPKNNPLAFPQPRRTSKQEKTRDIALPSLPLSTKIPVITPIYDEMFVRFEGDETPLSEAELEALAEIVGCLPDSHLQSLFQFLLIAAPDRMVDVFTERMEEVEKVRLERQAVLVEKREEKKKSREGEEGGGGGGEGSGTGDNAIEIDSESSSDVSMEDEETFDELFSVFPVLTIVILPGIYPDWFVDYMLKIICNFTWMFSMHECPTISDEGYVYSVIIRMTLK